MRFQTQLLNAIRDGKKTVTRRLVRTEKCPYKVGNKYAATNRPRFDAAGTSPNTKHGWYTIPIKVTSISREYLSEITEEDAVREGLVPRGGLTARDQFLLVWGKIHGWDIEDVAMPEVWRIEFQRVPESWK